MRTYLGLNARLFTLCLLAITLCGCENQPQRIATTGASAPASGVEGTAANIIPTFTPIRPRAPGEEPRLDANMVVVFDASGSMDGNKLIVAKQAVSNFLKQAVSTWNVGVIVFNGNGVWQMAPINRWEAEGLSRLILPISAGGGTPLGQSIDQANNLLLEQKKKQQGYGQYSVLVVTDGEASDGSQMNEAVTRILKNGFNLEVIGYELPGDHSLKKYATRYKDAHDANALNQALTEVLAESKEGNPQEKFIRLK